MEDLQHPDRLALEQARIPDRQAVALDDQAVTPAACESEAWKGEAGRTLLLLLEGCAEDPGQRAHVHGDEVVALHETLDGADTIALAIAHPSRDLGLQVEGEAVFGAAGEIVKVAADRPQEAARPQEPHQRLAREQTLPHELARIVARLDEAGDPQQRLQVAQTALALLDVGFEQEARVAHALMALVPFGELGLGERGTATGGNVVREAPLQLAEQLGRAPQRSRFDQRGLDGQIGLGEPDGVLYRADRLADLEAQIPELVEQELRDLLDMRSALVGAEEQEVDVGSGRQLLASVAADRHHRELLAGRGI